jgi:hypothetical protein
MFRNLYQAELKKKKYLKKTPTENAPRSSRQSEYY